VSQPALAQVRDVWRWRAARTRTA